MSSASTIEEGKLRKICGLAPLSHLFCDHCNKINVSSAIEDPTDSFAIHITCLCQNKWVVCTKCQNQRSRLKTNQQYSRHRLKHRRLDNNDSSLRISKRRKPNEPSDEDKAKFHFGFDREESREYFRFQHNGGNGIKFLIGRANSIPLYTVS